MKAMDAPAHIFVSETSEVAPSVLPFLPPPAPEIIDISHGEDGRPKRTRKPPPKPEGFLTEEQMLAVARDEGIDLGIFFLFFL